MTFSTAQTPVKEYQIFVILLRKEKCFFSFYYRYYFIGVQVFTSAIGSRLHGNESEMLTIRQSFSGWYINLSSLTKKNWWEREIDLDVFLLTER